MLRDLGDVGVSGPRTPASPASSISPHVLQASACTTDDIVLLGYMLDDKDNSVKTQALNTLKAFSGIRKFRLKIQVSLGMSGGARRMPIVLKSFNYHRINGHVPEVCLGVNL